MNFCFARPPRNCLPMNPSLARRQTALAGSLFPLTPGRFKTAQKRRSRRREEAEADFQRGIRLLTSAATNRGSALPLTPTLSRGERENRFPIWQLPSDSGLSAEGRRSSLPINLSFAKYQLRLRDAPFPSPRPSPRGRGRIASRSGTGPHALVCRETPAVWLPLPEGEGWGEGEQDVSQPDASDVGSGVQSAKVFGKFSPQGRGPAGPPKAWRRWE